MDNRLNETRRKISFLRSEMLVTEDIIRKQIGAVRKVVGI